MNKRINNEDVSKKRMLSEKELQTYSGLGRSTCRKVFAGMSKHIGRRVLYDRELVDKFLSQNSDDSQCDIGGATHDTRTDG